MCRFCDQIGPVCAHFEFRDFEGYCLGSYVEESLEECVEETPVSASSGIEASTQTCLQSEPAPPPRPAPKLREAISAEPREPPAATNKWFDVRPGPAEASEILFLALAITWNAPVVSELKEWAAEVCREEQHGQRAPPESWTRPTTAEWEPNGKNLGRLLRPVHAALSMTATNEFLEQTCKAMQVLRLPGHRDGMTPSNIKWYLKSLPSEAPCKDSKRSTGLEPRMSQERQLTFLRDIDFVQEGH
ncbi:hypothetical protein AB1Y20_010012 [Prymnesium parvum]|uniref:Uncharacterized protein n=1 Tax=Prymnesium parvum TaxID=97485 RepID=A0AB34K719_PRYPA